MDDAETAFGFFTSEHQHHDMRYVRRLQRGNLVLFFFPLLFSDLHFPYRTNDPARWNGDIVTVISDMGRDGPSRHQDWGVVGVIRRRTWVADSNNIGSGSLTFGTTPAALVKAVLTKPRSLSVSVRVS